MASTSTD
jgi:hypothetical protein